MIELPPQAPVPGGFDDEGYDLERSYKECCAIAEASGLVCVRPQPNQLFIDLDSEDAAARFRSLVEMYQRLCEPCEWIATPSKSPGHYHAVVTLVRHVESEEQRITLQAILGSDQKREMMGLARIRAGSEDDAITVFFEPKPPEPVTFTQETP
jgi:hypothetical protein